MNETFLSKVLEMIESITVEELEQHLLEAGIDVVRKDNIVETVK